MRTQYNNGDNINLLGNGCDGCNIVMVNGILCHETGCPDEWRDLEIECSECRFEFQPENRDQTICDGCQHPNRIDEADAIQEYNNMLDETNPVLTIGFLEFNPSRVLEELDPIAHHCGFIDWCDSMEYEIE